MTRYAVMLSAFSHPDQWRYFRNLKMLLYVPTGHTIDLLEVGLINLPIWAAVWRVRLHHKAQSYDQPSR